MNKNIKKGLIIIGIAIAIVIIVPLIIGGLGGWQGWGMMGPGMMGGYGNYGGYGWGWLISLVMIVFWALIIAGVVILVMGIVRGHGSNSQGSGMDSAMEILKRRYAGGEISKQEFEEKKKDLM